MFNFVRHCGSNMAHWLGDKTQFGVNESNPSYYYDSKIFSSSLLAQWLHYEAYDPEHCLFFNKKSQGFILEVAPLTGANEEIVNLLASVLTDSFPLQTDLQFLLWGSNKIGTILDRFEQERCGKDETLEWLAKKRTDFLKLGTQKSLISQSHFLLRDIRLWIIVSSPNVNSLSYASNLSEKLMEIRENLKGTLKSISVSSQHVSIEDFLSVLHDLINPSSSVYPSKIQWNEYDSLSLQLINAEHKILVCPDHLLFESSKEKIETQILTVQEYPKTMAQWKMTDSIGQLFNTSLQIPCPFVLNFSLRLLPSDQSILKAQYKYLNKSKTAASPLSKFKPLINQEYEDWQFVRTRLAEGDLLVKTFYSIALYSPENESALAERKLKDLYRTNGWKIRKERFLQFPIWLSFLPMRMSEGMYEDLELLGRLKTVTAFNAVNLAPIQGEWKGTMTPSLLLPGRRGQLATWNPFDNTEGNYNVAIAAASGKGKSMLTQEYITCLLGSGGRVWVIDIGRSYEKTCRLLKGTFVEFVPDCHISLNPFTHIQDFDASLVLLKPLLAAMARPSSQTSDEEISFLEKALKAAWDTHHQSASITTVAHWLAQQSSPICQNLSHLLYTYTRDGMYGKYFEGCCNVDLNNSFVVLELQELKTKKDLQRIILLVLLYQISETMYLGNRDQIKTCIIDEAWDLLGGENEGAARFIETGYRTARRFRANFVTITQSLNDYFKNNTTLAAFENSDFQLILGQKAEAIEQLKQSGRLILDPFTERLYKSLRKTDEYSECIIKAPSGLSVHRIIFDPYSRILYSSKGEDYEAVKSLMSSGKSLREAVEMVASKMLS